MNQIKKIIKYFLPILPAIIGFYGFMQVDGIKVSWALYNTIRLYGLNTDISDINIYIEIARWLAPVSTAGIFIVAIGAIKNNVIASVRSLRKDSCSVYGDTPEASDFLVSLGKSGIKGEADKIRKSTYHVLMFEHDEQTLEFYAKHEKDLKNHQVFLAMKRNQQLNIKSGNLFVFSMADNCAIQYWENNLAAKTEKIALIGEGELTDILLYRGLLTNIIALDQNIEYHIWKKDCDFIYRYQEFKQIKFDHIVFHEEPYYRQLPLLEKMDRIILCGNDEDNIEILSGLSQMLIDPVIHIKLRAESGIHAIYDSKKITVFGTSEKLMTREIIIKEQLMNRAKKLHQYYYEQYGGKNWDELDAFKKQANLFSAQYGIVIQQLFQQGTNKVLLTQLVHECWCRFHYLNGWHYSKTRDDSNKLHNLLVPFEQLAELEVQKDRDLVEQFIAE